jgi:cytochrome c-type biogenesis protein
MLDVLLAFAAGALTIAAPCVLPMLPIILGASAGQSDRLRPVLIILGFAAVFSATAFLFGLFPTVLGLSPESVRQAAAFSLLLFGLLMIWPHPFEIAAAHLNVLLGRAHLAWSGRPGRTGAFLLGASLGAVWVPCAGPVLGSILTLIASADRLNHAALLLTCYTAGAALPMLLIAYGGQYFSTQLKHAVRYTRVLQQGFGIATILVAAATYNEYDAIITAWLTRFYPDLSAGL